MSRVSDKLIKVASAVRDLKSSLSPMSYGDMAFLEAETAAPVAAGLAGLGGLAAYGGIAGKRNIENSVIKSLEENIKLHRLAEQIGANARARELLNGGGLEAASGYISNMLLNPNRLRRRVLSDTSESLLNIIRRLQKSKIL